MLLLHTDLCNIDAFYIFLFDFLDSLLLATHARIKEYTETNMRQRELSQPELEQKKNSELR